MVTRIRRNRPTPINTTGIEALMKSISQKQDTIDRYTSSLASDTAALYEQMKAHKLTQHQVGKLLAQLVRSAGRATNVIDPQGFRKRVPDDKEFYSAVKVSVTAARKILPEKQLKPITTNFPGELGEEVVKVTLLP